MPKLSRQHPTFKSLSYEQTKYDLPSLSFSSVMVGEIRQTISSLFSPSLDTPFRRTIGELTRAGKRGALGRCFRAGLKNPQ